MTGLALFIYTVGMFWIGYYNGRKDGKQEGYLQGVADEYRAGYER
jgi:Na+/proline symporter